MHKIEAIILDLDGTLLNDNKVITDRTKNILIKIKNDIKIILASARQFCTIKPYLNDLGIIDDSNYTICLNGSLIVNNLEEKILLSFIDKDDILKLDKFILNNNIEWIYYTYDNRYNRKAITDIKDFVNKNKVYKIVGISDSVCISKLKSNIPEYINNLVEVTSSEETRIEFVCKGTSKVKSLEFLLNKLNISKENVVAIGDGDNDISMIEYVELGIAMQNAPDSVKEKADLITEYTNNEDGVGIVIEELLSELNS